MIAPFTSIEVPVKKKERPDQFVITVVCYKHLGEEDKKNISIQIVDLKSAEISKDLKEAH